MGGRETLRNQYDFVEGTSCEPPVTNARLNLMKASSIGKPRRFNFATLIYALGLNQRIVQKSAAATAAEAGIVRIQAQTILPATPQRTAERR